MFDNHIFGRLCDWTETAMSDLTFTQFMGNLQEKLYLKPPARELRLKPWTSADIAKFAASNPKAGADLNTLRSAGLLTGIGGLASAGMGGAFFASQPGTFNGKIFSAVLGWCPAPPSLSGEMMPSSPPPLQNC